MKTYNNLYDKICSFENIYSAYLKARKGKRYHNDVIKFSINLEENLISIRDRLIKLIIPGNINISQFMNQKREKLRLYHLKIE